MSNVEDDRPHMRTCGSLFDLTGKTALVTGASRGLGAAAARALDRAGARVALVARTKSSLTEVAAGLTNEPMVFEADISDPGSPAEIVGRVEDETGHLDVVVNNAGISNLGPAQRMSIESWDEVFAVNLRAAFLFSKASSAGMRSRGYGKIVNVASVISHASDAHSSAYSASKTGILGLTRALAVEWAGYGIRVNALSPGWVLTEMTAPLKENEAFANRVLGSVPQRRWGEPEDLDGAFVFLASPASDFMTGQDLTVDGGLLAKW
jgi:NAD(P)-dependent dehydrogenase (short-subunit alcohol dehydrogenase family)